MSLETRRIREVRRLRAELGTLNSGCNDSEALFNGSFAEKRIGSDHSRVQGGKVEKHGKLKAVESSEVMLENQ